MPLLNILYEDNHCLAVNKPAGLLVQGDETGDETLIEQAREYLKRKYSKPGNVYVGLVHRLDRPVSGVVLLARTSKAAARLSEEFRARRVRKVYWALVEGRVPEAAGTWTDRIEKDPAQNRSRVVRAAESGLEAVIHFTRLESGPRATLLEIVLETGRGHQIRVQCAERGWPVWGDVKYGSRQRLGRRIALHARALALKHPVRGERLEIAAPLPGDWPVTVLGSP